MNIEKFKKILGQLNIDYKEGEDKLTLTFCNENGYSYECMLSGFMYETDILYVMDLETMDGEFVEVSNIIEALITTANIIAHGLVKEA